MKVWVVVSDIGLNGLELHGVLTREPFTDEVIAMVRKHGVDRWGGYHGTEILEWDLDAPLGVMGSDQSTWPAHLRDDAPSQRCDKCGRHTWSVEEFGRQCLMSQPNGIACTGWFSDVK